jgi:hypothetical protein
MDGRTFDRWTASVARSSSRRTALRLVAGGVLGGWLTQVGARTTWAAPLDRDGDGLSDRDEVNIHHTNPDAADTDRDGADDGQEVRRGTDPLDPLSGYWCPPGQLDCGAGQGLAGCVDIMRNAVHCGGCGNACGHDEACLSATCVQFDPPDVTCTEAGLSQCAAGGCANLRSDPKNCGWCGYRCWSGDICQDGICVIETCPADTIRCGNVCTDTNLDAGNCGRCGRRCQFPLICCSGTCVDIATDRKNCGGCGNACFTGSSCENYECD